MTQPEALPPEDGSANAASSAPLGLPEGLAREHEAIDIDELDKENRGWTLTYVATLRERLATEQGASSLDFVMISYLKRELATYQELLDRTEKK